MDIALVIPSRDSVGKINHAAMLRSVKNLIEQFSVLEGRSHVAIIQFAKKAVVSVPTSDLSSPQMLNEAIRAVQNEPKDLGQGINIYKALGKVAKNIFKEDNDSRPSSIDLVILLTNKPADDEDRRNVIQDLEVAYNFLTLCLLHVSL